MNDPVALHVEAKNGNANDFYVSSHFLQAYPPPKLVGIWRDAYSLDKQFDFWVWVLERVEDYLEKTNTLWETFDEEFYPELNMIEKAKWKMYIGLEKELGGDYSASSFVNASLDKCDEIIPGIQRERSDYEEREGQWSVFTPGEKLKNEVESAFIILYRASIIMAFNSESSQEPQKIIDHYLDMLYSIEMWNFFSRFAEEHNLYKDNTPFFAHFHDLYIFERFYYDENLKMLTAQVMGWNYMRQTEHKKIDARQVLANRVAGTVRRGKKSAHERV